MTPEFLNLVEAIPYQYSHSKIIHSLMISLKVKTAIEVGCHIGYTSVWMAQALKENFDGFVVHEGESRIGVLACIDPFCWVNETQEEQWVENVCKCEVSDYVELIKGRSEEVEWPKAEFVFVDGNHTYPVAKHDAEKARDVARARCIVLHDTIAWDGSRKHADEVRVDPAWEGWDKLEIPSECGMMILMRRDPLPESWGHDIGEQWDKPTVKPETGTSDTL